MSERLAFFTAERPERRRFLIDHFLLNALFVALAGTYWALLGWHFLK
jgi:hypothetical protein